VVSATREDLRSVTVGIGEQSVMMHSAPKTHRWFATCSAWGK